MPYIKVNEDKSVTLAGMVADESMLNEGYFMYEGEIPQCAYTFGQSLVYENEMVVAKVLDVSVTKKVVTATIQKVLDDKAKEKGYDDVVSACSYAAVENVFQAESKKFVVWRANMWAYAFAQLAAVAEGMRTLPMSTDELVAELPAYEGV